MIKIIKDVYIRVEIDGVPLKRCEEIVRGKNFDENKVVEMENHFEYAGEYAIVPVGENVKLILGYTQRRKP